MNISHQTLEVMRFAAADPAVTHVLKVGSQGGGGRNRQIKGSFGWTGKRTAPVRVGKRQIAGRSSPAGLLRLDRGNESGPVAGASWSCSQQAACKHVLPLTVVTQQQAGSLSLPQAQVDDDSYVHFDRLLHRLGSLPRCASQPLPLYLRLLLAVLAWIKWHPLSSAEPPFALER